MPKESGSLRKRTWRPKKDKPCERGEEACKQGERYWETGRKVRSGSLPSPALISEGGRPYILEHPPVYAGADGRIRFLFLGFVFLWEVQPAAALAHLPQTWMNLKFYFVGLAWHNVFLILCKSTKNLWNKVLGSKKQMKRIQ